MTQRSTTQHAHPRRATLSNVLAHLLHLLVFFNDKVVVLKTHLTVAGNVRVCIRDWLHHLMERRRRLNEFRQRNRLLLISSRGARWLLHIQRPSSLLRQHSVDLSEAANRHALLVQSVPSRAGHFQSNHVNLHIRSTLAVHGIPLAQDNRRARRRHLRADSDLCACKGITKRCLSNSSA